MSESGEIRSRAIGPVSYIILLLRVPLIATAVLVATLSDWAINGSMREALRYALLDQTNPHQLEAVGFALVLVCFAIRATGEASVELTAPDLFLASGFVGRMARWLPRASAVAVGMATALPLCKLALDSAMAPEPSAILGTQIHYSAAALAGLVFIAIGLAVGFGPIGPPRFTTASDVDSPAPGIFLRLSIVLLPLAIALMLCGTILGLWPAAGGVARDVVARYESADTLKIAAEGLALFLSCIAAGLVTAISIDLLFPGLATADSRWRLVHRWLPSIASLAVALVICLQVAVAYLGPGAKPLSRQDTFWLTGILVGYLLIGLAAGWFDRLGGTAPSAHAPNAFQRVGRRWLDAAERTAALAPGWRLLFGGFLIAAIAVTAFFVDFSQVRSVQAIGPVAVILLWGFAATILFFPIAYLASMTRVPLLLILVFAGVVFAGYGLNDNHGLRGIETATAASPPRVSTVASSYNEDLDLGAWIASRKDRDAYEHYPVFLIATEGGGIRAAYFTASVLAAIEDRCPAFAQHTIAISGVSGGSVGAAVFTALAADHAENASAAPCPLDQIRAPNHALVNRARAILSADLLSPLLGATLFGDALQRILPIPIERFDRSRALEFALEDSWSRMNADCAGCGARMAAPVRGLYDTAGIHAVPHLFLNTTEVGTGRAVPFATAHVRPLASPYLLQAELDPVELNSFNEPYSALASSNHDNVPLSAAAVLSARFPYLTPAGRVEDVGHGVGHYVDGGYFENSGTSLLTGIVENLIGQKLMYKNDKDPKLAAAVHGAVFVTIVIQSAPCSRHAETDHCEEENAVAGMDDSWNEVMSPVRALLNTRDRRADYSLRELSGLTALVEQLTDPDGGTLSLAGQTPIDNGQNAASEGAGCHYTICTVALKFRNEANVEVPLTWVLSPLARASMDRAVERIATEPVRGKVPDSAVPDSDAPVARGDRVLGSYRRILCLLADRKGEQGCTEPSQD